MKQKKIKKIVLEIDHKPFLANFIAGFIVGILFAGFIEGLFFLVISLFGILTPFEIIINASELSAFVLCVGILGAFIMPFLDDPVYNEKKKINAMVIK